MQSLTVTVTLTVNHLRPLPLLALDYSGGGVGWLGLHAGEQIDTEGGECVGVSGERLVLKQFEYLQTHGTYGTEEKEKEETR